MKISKSVIAVVVLQCSLAAGAILLTPKLTSATTKANLDTLIPTKFGDWTEVPSNQLQVNVFTGAEKGIAQPYDETVMKTYVNRQGEAVMLALAWGAEQNQEVKVHRPELCYVAQGFQIKDMQPHDFNVKSVSGTQVAGHRMLAMSNSRGEAISYWIRIGGLYSEGAVDTRLHIFKEGLKGHVLDGILVRASSIVSARAGSSDLDRAYKLQERFLSDLVAAAPQGQRGILAP